MKLYNLLRKLFILIFLICIQNTQAQNYFPNKPEPAQYVNDFAGFMPEEQIQTLEQKLKAYKDSTTTQIVIVTVKSLEEHTVKEYANDLAENWGIGQKGADNGLLILASKQERKVRIEIGYGLEAKITDAFTKQIINNHIIPNFKQGDFYQGFEKGVDIIISALAGEVFEADTENDIVSTDSQSESSEGMSSWMFFVIIIPIVALGIWWNKRKNINKLLQEIEKLLQSEEWESWKEYYDPQEIDSTQEELSIEFVALSKTSERTLSNFKYKINQIRWYTEKHFSLRKDKEMEKLGNQVIESFVTQEIFTASKRQETQKEIAIAIETFAKKGYENLTAEDFAQIQANIALYKQIIDNPLAFFGIDFEFLKTELDKISQKEFWLNYANSGKYTEESIEATKTEFEQEYHRIFAIEDETVKKQAMIDYYQAVFAHFLELPSSKLNLIHQTTYQSYSDYADGTSTSHSTSTYSSSYSDYSDTSSYSDYSDARSYSDYSDSYSDFGGGSFGGGGAEGEW